MLLPLLLFWPDGDLGRRCTPPTPNRQGRGQGRRRRHHSRHRLLCLEAAGRRSHTACLTFDEDMALPTRHVGSTPNLSAWLQVEFPIDKSLRLQTGRVFFGERTKRLRGQGRQRGERGKGGPVRREKHRKLPCESLTTRTGEKGKGSSHEISAASDQSV